MARSPYRDGVTVGRDVLLAERARLIAVYETLRRPDEETRRLRGAVDAPLTSAVDAASLSASLEDLDTAVTAAAIAESQHRSRRRVRVVLAALLALTFVGSTASGYAGRADQQCELPCRERGACTKLGASCVASEMDHCTESEACRSWGRCKLDKDRCIVWSDELCEESAGCRRRGDCYVAFNRSGRSTCRSAEDFRPQRTKGGTHATWFRAPHVARSQRH